MTTELTTLILLTILGIIIYKLLKHFSSISLVHEHEFALHYKNGKFIGLLEAGRHSFLGSHHAVRTLDKRKTELTISGQELLTQDQATLKVTGLVRYRISDPQLYLTASSNPEAVLYTAGQIAIRDLVSNATLEDVLARNIESADSLTKIVQLTGQQLGFEIETVILKDLMPNGEIKGVLTGALLAKKRALIELETARGAAAALRIKSNAARIYEKQPALLQLELIQALQTNGLGYNNTFSFNGLDELKKLMQK